MTRKADSLRYIDIFLESFAEGNADSVAAFGHHVHWGLWDAPGRADGTTADFVRAAEVMTRTITACAGAEDGKAVLDAGCGFGGTLSSLNDRYRGMRLVGVNIDARQIARARAAVSARPENTLDFVESDALAIPLDGDAFDAVLSIESICHFGDQGREKFFAEARRLLRPGGRLVVVDFVPSPLLRPWIVANEVLFGWFSQAVYGPMNVRCTLDGYRALAARHGYAVTEERDVTVNTIPSYEYTRRLMAKFSRPWYETMANASINSSMEWLSRQGLLRYMILTFTKEPA